jgi:membrane fusion protein (multidrug efflux system)
MQAGEQLTTLTGAGNERWIDFKVPQGLAEVSVGDTVRLLAVGGELLGEAEIIAVADAYNSAIRAYDVRALVRDGRLRHGEMLQVEVQAGRGRQAMRVPNQAVRWDVDGPHVYALVAAPADSHTPYLAELRRVSVLDERDGVVLVSGELEAGEQIASAGAFKLSPDTPVLVAERRDNGSQGGGR